MYWVASALSVAWLVWLALTLRRRAPALHSVALRAFESAPERWWTPGESRLAHPCGVHVDLEASTINGAPLPPRARHQLLLLWQREQARRCNEALNAGLLED